MIAKCFLLQKAEPQRVVRIECNGLHAVVISRFLYDCAYFGKEVMAMMDAVIGNGKCETEPRAPQGYKSIFEVCFQGCRIKQFSLRYLSQNSASSHLPQSILSLSDARSANDTCSTRLQSTADSCRTETFWHLYTFTQDWMSYKNPQPNVPDPEGEECSFRYRRW